MFLITGGGSGVGRALAQALALRNKQVLIVGRSQSSLAEAATFSPLIHYLCADVSTAKGRQSIVSKLEQVSTLEAVVHNAGVIEPLIPLANVDEASWQKLMAINVNAPLFLTQLLLKKLQRGRVLNVGSGAAYFPAVGWGAYCTSKAALSMLTRCWQLESETTAFAAVMPGIIDTNMQALLRQSQVIDGEKRKFFQNLHEEGRLITPETVALFLTWLLLDIDEKEFASQEWDIYDRAHHFAWLKPNYHVPSLDDK